VECIFKKWDGFPVLFSGEISQYGISFQRLSESALILTACALQKRQRHPKVALVWS